MFRVSGFSARVNFDPESPFRPDLRVLAWTPLRALLEAAWRADAKKRASAALLLQKLQVPQVLIPHTRARILAKEKLQVPQVLIPERRRRRRREVES